MNKVNHEHMMYVIISLPTENFLQLQSGKLSTICNCNNQVDKNINTISVPISSLKKTITRQ